MTTVGDIGNNKNRDSIRKDHSTKHELTLLDRKRMEIGGVKDVKSFDESEVILDTDLGQLEIAGEELHISVLDLEKGRVTLDGRIDSVAYSDSIEKVSAQKRGVLGRLFR